MATSIPRFLLPRLSWVPAHVTVPAHASRASAAAFYRQINTQSRGQRGLRTSSERQTASQSAIIKKITETRRGARIFSTTVPQARDHHFDTLKFVQRFQDEGFSEEQAAAMMKVLGDVVEERSVVRGAAQVGKRLTSHATAFRT